MKEPDSLTNRKLYSVEDAARLLSISPWTLRKWIANGGVPVTRIGRRVLLAVESVERLQRNGLPSLGRAGRGDVSTYPDNAMRVLRIGDMALAEDEQLIVYVDQDKKL
jgi:excisionase family DNA binding protein